MGVRFSAEEPQGGRLSIYRSINRRNASVLAALGPPAPLQPPNPPSPTPKGFKVVFRPYRFAHPFGGRNQSGMEEWRIVPCLPSFFYRVSLCLIAFHGLRRACAGAIGFYWVLLCFFMISCSLSSYTGLYNHWFGFFIGFTGFYWVLPGFSEDELFFIELHWSL